MARVGPSFREKNTKTSMPSLAPLNLGRGGLDIVLTVLPVIMRGFLSRSGLKIRAQLLIQLIYESDPRRWLVNTLLLGLNCSITNRFF